MITFRAKRFYDGSGLVFQHMALTGRPKGGTSNFTLNDLITSTGESGRDFERLVSAIAQEAEKAGVAEIDDHDDRLVYFPEENAILDDPGDIRVQIHRVYDDPGSFANHTHSFDVTFQIPKSALFVDNDDLPASGRARGRTRSRARKARKGRATGFKLAPWETRALVRSYTGDIERAKRLTALKRVLAYVKGHPFEFKETTKGRVEHLIYLEQSGRDSTQSRISQDVLKAMLAVDARAYPLAAEAVQPVVARRVMSVGQARGRAQGSLVPRAEVATVFTKIKQASQIHARRKGDPLEPAKPADVLDTQMAFRRNLAQLYKLNESTYEFELDDDYGYDRFILSTVPPKKPRAARPYVLSTKGIKVVSLGPYVVDEWAGFEVEISGHWPEPKDSQEQKSYMQRIGPVAWPIIRKAVEAYRAKHKNQTVSVLPDGAGGWDEEQDKVQRYVPYPNSMSDFNEYEFSHDSAWLSLSHRDD